MEKAKAISPSSKVFPAIGATSKAGEGPPSAGQDQRGGRAILALAERRLSRLERWSGWRLDAASRPTRLLLFHRIATESEMAGQTRLADFFWHEAHAQLRELATQDEVWPILLQETPEAQESSQGSDPQQGVRTLARELFLETHQALFRGLGLSLQVPPADHRSYVHLDYLRDTIDLAGLSKEEQREALLFPTIKQVGAYQEARRWKRAERLSTDLLKRFPELAVCQALYANLIFVKTVSGLNNGNSEAVFLRDAKTLRNGVDRLQRLRREYPHNWVMLELVGHLYYLRSVKLANASRLAQALADVQAAVTYAPELSEAQDTRDRLEAMMQDLRVQLSEATAKTDQEPKAVLSLKGLRMKREVAQGFRLMDIFKNSEEARLTGEDVRAARARRVWEQIGLAPLERTDLRPLGLYQTLQTICQAPPALAGELPAIWQQAADDDPELSGLDSSKICAYLTSRLFGAAAETYLSDLSLPPAASDEQPVLVPVPAPPRLKREPLGYWLFSHQGQWVKLQCVICGLLLVIVSGFAAREYLHRQSRAAAYREIYLAKDTQDFRRMVEHAETFLSNPILGADGRADEVKALYSEALVRWASSREMTPEQLDFHGRRYRALVMGIAEKGQ